jgi:hypothetical protein
MKLPRMLTTEPPLRTGAHYRATFHAVSGVGTVQPMLNQCHYDCLIDFQNCPYFAWGTPDYCNQQFAHCLASC